MNLKDISKSRGNETSPGAACLVQTGLGAAFAGQQQGAAQSSQALNMPAPPQRETHELIQSLDLRSSILSESLARLQSRLQPVLATWPSKDSSGERRSASCPLGDALMSLDMRLELLNETVETIEARLQV